MFKKLLCMAMAFALAMSSWAEDLKMVMQYYQPDMSKGFIFISKVDMTLTLVDKQGHPVVTYPIACGRYTGQKQVKGDNRTPEGHFLLQMIQESSNWGHDFHDGKGFIRNAYGPYFLRLRTGFQGIGIHGTHAPQSIGTRATEGCIRLENKNVEALERQVTLGMPVIIGPENGVQSLIASNTPRPARPRWQSKPAAPAVSSLSEAEVASDAAPLVIRRQLPVVDGLLDIDPERDLIDEPLYPQQIQIADPGMPIIQRRVAGSETQETAAAEQVLADNATDAAPVASTTTDVAAVSTTATEPAATTTEPAAAPAEPAETIDADGNKRKVKYRRRQGPVYIKPDSVKVTSETPYTQPKYEVIVEEVTLPDGTVKYEVTYKHI